MSRVVRSLVLWLIALAIPLQGMAGGIMLHCAPTQQAAGSPGLSHGVAHAPAAQTMAGLSAHAMHHGAVEHMLADHPGQDDDGLHGAGGQSGHNMLKCCSAACSMAAGVVPNLAVQAQARSPAPRQPVAQFYRGVALDGLDRPPKTPLA
jgi:hypothetical protein